MDENILTEEQKYGIVQAVQTGIASSEQIAEWSRLINISLASELLTGQKQIMSTLTPYLELQEKAMNRLKDLLEVDLENLELDQMIKLVDFIHKHTLNVLDLQRKIAQGKNLLSDYPQLTQEERSMLNLIKQLKTDDEKKMFVDTLKSVITTKNIVDKNNEADGSNAKSKSSASSSSDSDDFEDLPE